MKKLFLSLAMMMAVVFSANAQEYAKGDMLVGGAAEISFSSTKAYSDMSFSFSPTFRYFFSDKWAVGVSLSYEDDFIKWKDDDEKSSYSNMYLAPNISYVFPIGERWGMANTASIYFNINDGFSTSIYYTPSFYFFINDNWAINAFAGAVGYDFGYKEFDFRVGSTLGCGVYWRF